MPIREDLDLLFQHTAARRRLGGYMVVDMAGGTVSTHSRPKAAGFAKRTLKLDRHVSTHSRPKAAGTAV